MDRSSGFGSTTQYYLRSFQTRFRFGSVAVLLNLASHRNSPARSTKSTTSHSCGAMSARKHMVSGSISLPSRGAFHLSLTVLYSIGHMVVFSLMRWSSHSSVRIPRVPTYSGYSPARKPFNYGTFTLSRHAFQTYSSRLASPCGSPYPAHITICGLGWSDFARHYFRNRFYFLFLRVIRWFSSPGSPRMIIYSSYDSTTLLVLSFLIRISTVIRSFATHRSFSQLVTSFFGAMYQGILHTLFVA